MRKPLTLIRHTALALVVGLGAVGAASAQLNVGIGIGMPGVNIGIQLHDYPQLVRVPDYPVYYAPQLGSNFFFYDGLFWVYEQDDWYASDWYDGPWGRVDPQAVPYFVLRIPVRYYRNPPRFFRGWRPEAPPRWDAHWGPGWAQQRPGWDRWDRRAVPRPAPLPVYQRRYTGDRYPQLEQQREIRSRNYRYEPRESVVRQHVQQPPPAPARRAPEQRAPRAAPPQAPAPAAVPAPVQRPAVQDRPQRAPRSAPDAGPRPVPSPPQVRGNEKSDKADRADRADKPTGAARDAGRQRGQDDGRDNRGNDRGNGRGNDRSKSPDRGNADDHGPQPRK
jgi:hypothetical protein